MYWNEEIPKSRGSPTLLNWGEGWDSSYPLRPAATWSAELLKAIGPSILIIIESWLAHPTQLVLLRLNPPPNLLAHLNHKMAKRPMVRPFKPSARKPQHMSALQLEFLRQQEINAAHTEAALQAFEAQLMHQGPPQADEEPADAALDQQGDENDPADMELDDFQEVGAGNADNPDNLELALDVNHFIPDRSLDDIFAALESSRYQEGRRHHAESWMWQCAIMLPTYLRCRALTSSWGDNNCWNQDFRTPCTCGQQKRRHVDLFDILCKELAGQLLLVRRVDTDRLELLFPL